MPDTEGILTSNLFILVVIILLPLEFHSTDFEKLFLLRATHVLACLYAAGTPALTALF